jgi:hypothetical protein
VAAGFSWPGELRRLVIRVPKALFWISIVAAGICVVGCLSISGLLIGYQKGESLMKSPDGWVNIAPPGTNIAKLKVFSATDPARRGFVVLLITDQGNLLSSGVNVYAVQEWHWTDISHGDTWTEFPPVALAPDTPDGYSLWIKRLGKEYQVDQNGEWQPPTNPADSPFDNLPDNYADIEQDYTN